MKLVELINLQNGLNKAKEFKGTLFALWVVKNSKLVNAELEAAKEAEPEESKEFVTFRGNLNDFNERLQKARLDGNDEKFEKVAKDREKFIANNQKLINERNKELETYYNNETDLEPKLYKLKASQLPEDLDGEIIELLFPVIDLEN